MKLCTTIRNYSDCFTRRVAYRAILLINNIILGGYKKMSDVNKSTEAKQQAIVYLVQKRILTQPEQQATIQKVLADTAPALIEADRAAGLTDEEIFLKHADAWFQAHGDAAPEGAPSTPAHGKKTEPASVNLTAEEQTKLDMLINMNAVAKGKRSAQTQVVAVLTDKPVMSQIFVKGSTLTPVVPETAEEQMKKYESELVDTPENKQNFAQLKAAWMKGEQMQVYLNPKARQKVIGFKVNTLGENGTPETRIMTKEDAIVFLACEVNGIIPARDDNSIGIKLRWRANRKSDVTSNNNDGTSVVAIINLKILQNHPELSICTSVVVDSEVNDKYRAKTEMSFLRVGKRKNKKGESIQVRTRLSGTTKVKAVKRSDEFLATFGQVGARKSGQSDKSVKATRDAVRMTMRALTNDSMTLHSDAAKEAQARAMRDMATIGMNNGAPAGGNQLL